jgi:hypothetical protein
MEIQTQLSDEELVRRVNGRLIPALRQSAVLVEFAEPVSLPLLQDLTLVRLHQTELDRSEDARYLASLSDPAWFQRIKCHVCGGPVRLVGLGDVYLCKNARCVMATQKIAKLSHRGVTSVMWNRFFVARIERRHWITPGVTAQLIDVDSTRRPHVSEVVYLNRCIAMLDRRYDPVAIAAVYRTIGALADQKGWKLKGV